MIALVKKWLLHNFWPKVTVVILACGVWFLVKTEEDVTYQFNAMVNVRLAENMFLIDTNPQKVKVTVIGRRNVMKIIEDEDIPIHLDLRNKQQTQELNHHVTKAEIDLPPEIFIKDIDPDFVDIRIDKGIKKSLTVKEVYTGKPAPEYTLRSISVTPSVVEVFGPETVLKDRTAIETKPFSIDRMNKSFTQRVQLEPFYPGLRNLPVVDVYVEITRSLKTKNLSPVRVQIVKSPEQGGNISVKPSDVSLVIEGTESDLQSLKNEDIIVYIHVSGLKEGKYELPMRTIVPASYNVVKVEPEVADVTISLIEIKSQP